MCIRDRVESTATRSRLGEERADKLQETHDSLLRDVVDAHGGRVVKNSGDGVLATFGSGTDALAAAVEASPPRELEAQPYGEDDIALIEALQGPMAAVERPYDEAASELGIETDELLTRLRDLIDRKILRRVAAILYHRRAGFSANGMGVWKVPEGEILETGRRMASFRGISHCYQRPTYEDWPYSVFTMAHGRSKEECDAILDSIAAECGIGAEDRATLYSSTEYKKIRLHYFTEEYARWEAEHS